MQRVVDGGVEEGSASLSNPSQSLIASRSESSGGGGEEPEPRVSAPLISLHY